MKIMSAISPRLIAHLSPHPLEERVVEASRWLERVSHGESTRSLNHGNDPEPSSLTHPVLIQPKAGLLVSEQMQFEGLRESRAARLFHQRITPAAMRYRGVLFFVSLRNWAPDPGPDHLTSLLMGKGKAQLDSALHEIRLEGCAGSPEGSLGESPPLSQFEQGRHLSEFLGHRLPCPRVGALLLEERLDFLRGYRSHPRHAHEALGLSHIFT